MNIHILNRAIDLTQSDQPLARQYLVLTKHKDLVNHYLSPPRLTCLGQLVTPKGCLGQAINQATDQSQWPIRARVLLPELVFARPPSNGQLVHLPRTTR